ncbi:hypothetical protein RFI_04596 [Reticulomyxa filosa]|uniref:Uncharacterized protein n=1 Tax=Reticulomyxa filosa TaxID=46433 RepID=X6P316_RETFI|nr:hypothetical protein RFI_04596 [Reticulomyxa filosa]|eukprot:ETO32523.1 hypothetical protein RFI_04596 [Reticulomyxa filosa]
MFNIYNNISFSELFGTIFYNHNDVFFGGDETEKNGKKERTKKKGVKNIIERAFQMEKKSEHLHHGNYKLILNLNESNIQYCEHKCAPHKEMKKMAEILEKKENMCDNKSQVGMLFLKTTKQKNCIEKRKFNNEHCVSDKAEFKQRFFVLFCFVYLEKRKKTMLDQNYATRTRHVLWVASTIVTMFMPTKTFFEKRITLPTRVCGKKSLANKKKKGMLFKKKLHIIYTKAKDDEIISWNKTTTKVVKQRSTCIQLSLNLVLEI